MVYGRNIAVSVSYGNICIPYHQLKNQASLASVRIPYGHWRLFTNVHADHNMYIHLTYLFKAFLIALRSRWRRCFISMRTRIISGLRLARLSEMVSRPPEKIRSTATADPVNRTSLTDNWLEANLTYQELIEYPVQDWTSSEIHLACWTTIWQDCRNQNLHMEG